MRGAIRAGPGTCDRRRLPHLVASAASCRIAAGAVGESKEAALRASRLLIQAREPAKNGRENGRENAV